MAEPQPSISVVTALLNEEATVHELIDRISAAVAMITPSYEIICVDDGSQDGTIRTLRALERADPRVSVFELTRNFGQAAALACGLFAARGDLVVTIDGDLQNPPEEIGVLVAALDGHIDVATAQRGRRHEGFLRWLGSRAIHWLACRLTGVDIHDYGGNFKAYRRGALDATKRVWASGKPFFPLALALGYRVAEVTVRHEPRRIGSSRYTLPKLLRINFDLITAFSTLPLALLGIGGTALMLIGALAAVVANWNASTTPFSAWVALSLFTVGGLWFAAGVLGLYIGRIYHLVAGGEPGYVIRAAPLRPQSGGLEPPSDGATNPLMP